MVRKFRLCVLALATVAAAPPPPPLLAAVPPGPAHDALRRILLKPYADATETDLADPAWDGQSLEGLKTLAPDLALVTGEQALLGCRSGQFRKLDWSRLNRDRYLSFATGDCAAGAYVSATALAWDRDKFPGSPNWSDFWDVARHPGRRGLQRSARGTLEIALLADGVAPGDVYRTLGAPDGLDRAFRKLDQLKPYIQWWDQPAQPVQWLAAGKLLLTTAPAESEAGAAPQHHHLAVQWGASLIEARVFVVPQAATHVAAATTALVVAADVARQAMLAEATYLGPALRDAVDLLPVRLRAQSAAAPDILHGALTVDDGFWADHRAKLEQRFFAWLAK